MAAAVISSDTPWPTATGLGKARTYSDVSPLSGYIPGYMRNRCCGNPLKRGPLAGIRAAPRKPESRVGTLVCTTTGTNSGSITRHCSKRRAESGSRLTRNDAVAHRRQSGVARLDAPFRGGHISNVDPLGRGTQHLVGEEDPVGRGVDPCVRGLRVAAGDESTYSRTARSGREWLIWSTTIAKAATSATAHPPAMSAILLPSTCVGRAGVSVGSVSGTSNWG